VHVRSGGDVLKGLLGGDGGGGEWLSLIVIVRLARSPGAKTSK
jgi:hypothetical protein